MSRDATNEPDIDAILIDVRRSIAIAKISELERQAFRLGNLVGFKLLDRTTAADLLWDAAVANGLVAEHGPDEIQRLIAQGMP